MTTMTTTRSFLPRIFAVLAATVLALLTHMQVRAETQPEGRFEYEAALIALQEVDQALAQALRAVDRARRLHPLPGVDYERLRTDLEAIRAGLRPALVPARERGRYYELTPDSRYFRSLPVSE